MARKYVPGGGMGCGLNPIWCKEQDQKIQEQKIRQIIQDVGSSCDFSVSFDVGNTAVTISKNNLQNMGNNGKMEQLMDENSEYYKTLKSLEAKFQFIKNHSQNEEDLELARKIAEL